MIKIPYFKINAGWFSIDNFFKIKKVFFFNSNIIHPKLTRVRSIWFLLLEIKRVLVYNSTIFKLTDLFILYFHSKRIYRQKSIYEEWLKNYV